MSSISNSLRQYRFQKNKGIPNSKESSELKLVPGKKRIHTLDCSNSSNESSSPAKAVKIISDKLELVDFSIIRDREARLIAVKTKAPLYETMVCQDALVKCNWNVEDSVKYLNEQCTYKKRFETSKKLPESTSTIPAAQSAPVTKATSNIIASQNQSLESIRTQSVITYNQSNPIYTTSSSSTSSTVTCNGNNNEDYRRIKKKYHHENRSDDSGDDQEKPTEKVFDSDDDSDTEYSTYMTKDRKSVFDFINTGTVNELQSVKSCSIRKIDVIMELRPFNDWSDLVTKIQNHKHLSADLLNSCQEFLSRRNNVVAVMKKCNKIVQRLELVVSDGGGLLNQPSILNSEFKLADYQLVGLNWLVVMYREKMNGILADEMGLGKTIQVIAFLAYLKETNQAIATHLIIVPSSTLDNWLLEFERWCPILVVEKYYGNAEERKMLRIDWARGGLAGVDVILTTYHTVNSTPEERKMFRVTKIHYVIFDEAHMLKNMTTQRYAHLVRINAERRLLLTGTPLQNSLLELMSLLCFVMPSLFANRSEDIKSLFQKNKNANVNNDDVSLFEQSQIDQAKRIMKPFLLRRLKKDVLNSLPKKFEYTKKISLSVTQKEKYKELVGWHCSKNGIIKATNEQSGMSIMMDMRKLSNHPLLLRYYYTDEIVYGIAERLSKHPLYKKNPVVQYIFEELAILSDFQLYQMLERYDIIDLNIPDNLILDSGKFKELDVLLPKLKSEGHRVLIFSQFTMMLDILERYLDIREYGFLRLDGSTPVTERQDLIDKYMKDSELFVFLLSTKAGGLGINLTAADTVIIHDIDFNPYNDKQAEDRCHRMGQTKPVTIYRFISEGTIEEGMSLVATEKLNLEKEITNDGENGIQEQKCMIRLLTMALGMDENHVENMISPKKKEK